VSLGDLPAPVAARIIREQLRKVRERAADLSRLAEFMAICSELLYSVPGATVVPDVYEQAASIYRQRHPGKEPPLGLDDSVRVL
jgi:hypothetical protein